jgi:hypothetical protein
MVGVGGGAVSVIVTVGAGGGATFFSRTTNRYNKAAATIMATAKSNTHNQIFD